MVEVVRTDCDARVQALERQLADAGTVDEIVGVLVRTLESFVAEPDAQAVLYEMLSASRHSDEIQSELAELYRRWRGQLGSALRERERAGVVTLDGDPEAVASLLFALGDGMGLQLISDRDWDSSATLELGVRTARRLLGASD